VKWPWPFCSMGHGKSKNLAEAPLVVVIGGGFAGFDVAKQLDATMNVVLIDRKDYFLHTPATPRMMVDMDFTQSGCVPYTNLLKNGHVVQGQVTKVTDTEVFLHGKEEPITGFQYLVIATGMAYAFPYKVPESKLGETQELFERVNKKIIEATNIVLVGAGSTGLESASEIAEKWPDKQVTIVHSRARIMPGGEWGEWSDKFRDHLTEQINRYPNIKMIYEDRVLPVEALGGEEVQTQKYVEPADGKVMTEKGVELPCELLFWCNGGKVNKASYMDHFADGMDKRGVLQVDESLQVQNHKNVFSGGDCCSGGPQATVNFARQHAACIAANIKLAAAGKALKPYKPGPVMNITNLGKQYGTMQGPPMMGKPIVLGSKTVQMIKGDMYANKMWKDFGFKGIGDKEIAEAANAAGLQDVLNLTPEESEKLVAGLGVDPDSNPDHT